MAKDPAFLFYPGDWLGGTIGMTFEEKGAYMDVLILQFNRGHMTEDMIAHMLGQSFGRIWVKIKDKFQIDENGMYYNARLNEEKEKRKSFIQSRVNNKTGKNQYSKKEAHMRGHLTSHMENENENENINGIRNSLKRGYGGKTFKKSANFCDLDLGRAYFTEDGTVWQELGEEQKKLLAERKITYYEIYQGEIF
jgi:hypothetical protein